MIIIARWSTRSRPVLINTVLSAIAAVIVGGCVQSSVAPEPDQSTDSPLLLHARWVTDRWRDHGCGMPQLVEDDLRLAVGSDAVVCARSLPTHLREGEFTFDDPARSAALLLAALPEWNIVYPSEQYYYFQFDTGVYRIGGNFRLVDATDGAISIGYFSRLDPGEYRSMKLKAENGWAITVRELEVGRVVRVSCDTVTREFFLPRRVEQVGSEIALPPNERFISGVTDESGVLLSMIWCDLIGQFAFVRYDGAGPTDRWVRVLIRGRRFEYGRDSRFVFFMEPETDRRILVGVARDEILENSYFDGPFDQVPPRLSIKRLVESAYPYVKLAGGIDEHGSFLRDEGTRIAISPYAQYGSSLDDFLAEVAEKVDPNAHGQSAWGPAVWEPKRSAHLRAAKQQHAVAVSRSWPANHYGPVSASWPEAHVQAASRLATPNQPLPDDSK